jgi:hypothetical protein
MTSHCSKEAARRPNLDLYLVENEWVASTADRTFKFHMRVTNRAEAPNGIVEISLEIEYARGATSGLRLVIPHGVPADEPSLTLPRLLQPKESVSGWVRFVVPDELRVDVRTDIYRVVVVDTVGNRFEVRPIIIPERKP